MRIIEKTQQNRNVIFFMNDQNIMFGYPPLWKTRKIENVNQLILMNVKYFLIDPVLLKECNLFSQNTEISLEQ